MEIKVFNKYYQLDDGTKVSRTMNKCIERVSQETLEDGSTITVNIMTGYGKDKARKFKVYISTIPVKGFGYIDYHSNCYKIEEV